MKKINTSHTFLKMADERMHTLILAPGSAPRHKQQKLSKESGIAYFSHLAPLILLFPTRRQSQKGWRRHNAPPSNTLLPRSLRLGACERIPISSFK